MTKITEDSDIVVEGLCFLWTAALLFFASKCVKGKRTAKEMRVRDALIVGVFQGTAIMPGISRSGSTISSSLLLGFSKEYCVKFSFILGIPAILGASLLETKDAIESGIVIEWAPVLIGMLGRWLEDGMQMPPAELARMAEGIIQYGYGFLLHTRQDPANETN